MWQSLYDGFVWCLTFSSLHCLDVTCTEDPLVMAGLHQVINRIHRPTHQLIVGWVARALDHLGLLLGQLIWVRQ